MGEYVRTMSEEEFQKELKTLRTELAEMRTQECSRYEMVYFLIGWVTSPSARVHLPEQLSKVFDLTK